MTKSLTIQIPDELEQALSLQAQRLNKSPEEIVLDVLTQQIPSLPLPPESPAEQTDGEAILKLIGSVHLDHIHDLGENHDHYIGQALYRELHPDE